MRRLVLLDAALEDFADIFEHLTKKSSDRAVGRNFVAALQQQCAKLASLPGILGRARPELLPDIRSFVFKGYVIFFRYTGDRLEVVKIMEGHRDITAQFGDDTK